MAETTPQPPSQRTRRWKRTAAAALLLLAGGAVVNIAVAWGCVLVLPKLTYSEEALYVADRFREEPPYWMELSVEKGFGFRRHRRGNKIRDVLPEDSDAKVIVVQRDIQFAPQTFPLVRHGWSEMPSFRCKGRLHATEEAAGGWPCLALRLRIEEPMADWKCTGALHVGELSISGRHLNGSVQDVPLIPIVPGFIINTLFYGLLFWLLFMAPFATRRMIRRRRGFRGLCEKCAYPVGVSPVCTECGAPMGLRPAVNSR